MGAGDSIKPVNLSACSLVLRSWPLRFEDESFAPTDNSLRDPIEEIQPAFISFVRAATPMFIVIRIKKRRITHPNPISLGL